MISQYTEKYLKPQKHLSWQSLAHLQHSTLSSPFPFTAHLNLRRTEDTVWEWLVNQMLSITITIEFALCRLNLVFVIDTCRLMLSILLVKSVYLFVLLLIAY